MRTPRARVRPARAIAPGFALPTALFALVIIGALAAAAFFAALQEARLGRNGRSAEVAFDAAEAGLSAALAEGGVGGWGTVRPGDSLALSGALGESGGRFETTVLRLNGQLFLIRSRGTDANGAGERLLGGLARLGAPGVRIGAALVAGGAVELGAASALDGRDGDPPGWTGCPSVGRDTVAALALPDPSDLLLGPECAGRECLSGEPALLGDPALRDSVPYGPAGAGRTELARRATLVYPPGAPGDVVTPAPVGSADSCDRSAPHNWGEPRRPAAVAGCRSYFPVILAQGDLALAGGRGQGMLIVEGDLTLTGGAEFVGAALVGGVFRVSGAGGRVSGAVVAAGRGGGVAAYLEGASLAFSSCAVALAGAVAAPAKALPERSWAYLY